MRVDYYTAAWCKPCQSFRPLVARLCEERGYELRFIDVDNEEYEEQILSLPTLVVYAGNVRIGSVMGAFPEAALVQKFDFMESLLVN